MNPPSASYTSMPYCVGLHVAITAFLHASLPTQIVLVVFVVSAVFLNSKPTKMQLIDGGTLVPMFPSSGCLKGLQVWPLSTNINRKN